MLRISLIFLLICASSVSSLALFGCGDDDAQGARVQERDEVLAYDDPTEEFTGIMEELANAAEEERTYKAAREAKDLGPVEQSTVYWFCYTAWQLVVNDELDLLPDREYMESRLEIRVVLDTIGTYSPQSQARFRKPISIAVDEADRIVDFASFGPEESRRYKRTCYGGPK